MLPETYQHWANRGNGLEDRVGYAPPGLN